MSETKEREAYIKRSRYYGVEGNCHKQSHAERIYGYYFAVQGWLKVSWESSAEKIIQQDM